jgi:hypothetical protein
MNTNMNTPNPTPAKERTTPKTDAEADALARTASDDLLQTVAHQNPKDVLRIGSEVIAARKEISRRLSALRSSNGQLESRVARLEQALHDLMWRFDDDCDDADVKQAHQALRRPKTDAGEHQS